MNTTTVENMPQIRAGGSAGSAGITENAVLGAAAQECLARADAAYRKGDLPAACEFLQQGLREAPGSPALLGGLGNVQFQMGEFAAAVKSFTTAVAADGDNVDLLVRLAMAAAQCTQVSVFEKTMARVFKLDPENVFAHRFMGKLNLANDHFVEAAFHFGCVVKQERDDLESLLHAGDCHLKLNHLPAARQMFERAVALDAGNIVAGEKLKQLRLQEQLAPAAEACKNQSVSPAPKPAGNLESLIDDIRKDKIARPHYAHGLLLATLQAMKIGVKEISVFEFGVLRGDGLLNLCSICERITADTGFQFKIFGFDSDVGMPEITDYRDHPEIWYTGQFKVDHALLTKRLPANARLIVGDIAKTIGPFCRENLSAECPVGFVAIDVDLYSSTKSAFKIFKGEANCYLPAVVMYFDDVNDMITLNSWCGEALAIKEFNRASKFRKIEEKWTRQNTANAGCHDQIYCCHVLDHPVRSGKLKCASLDLNVTIY
jgi:tetratricopeptide (TPR) repeat protein